MRCRHEAQDGDGSEGEPVILKQEEVASLGAGASSGHLQFRHKSLMELCSEASQFKQKTPICILLSMLSLNLSSSDFPGPNCV